MRCLFIEFSKFWHSVCLTVYTTPHVSGREVVMGQAFTYISILFLLCLI